MKSSYCLYLAIFLNASSVIRVLYTFNLVKQVKLLSSLNASPGISVHDDKSISKKANIFKAKR